MRASRPLIEANAKQIQLLKENSQLKSENIELQQAILELRGQQLEATDQVIAGEREAKARTELQLGEVLKRNEQLEKKLSRSRKLSLGVSVLAILFSVLVLR